MIAAELTSGIRNIQFAVSYEVRERGGTITGNSFEWNYHTDSERPPDIVSARITSDGKIACLVLPKEYCDYSAVEVSRTEVWEAIHDCVGFLTARQGEGLVDNLEKLSKPLGNNFPFDMKAARDKSHKELSDIQTPAVNLPDQMLDRIRHQISSHMERVLSLASNG